MRILARLCVTADGYVTTPDSDPGRLLERLRAAGSGGDVHLVGGPSTLETFRALGVVDKLELVVLPFMVGSPDAADRFTGRVDGAFLRKLP